MTLIVVDIQVDLCPGGSLAVSQGDRVVPVLSQYLERAVRAGILIYASRDWHPAETTHVVTGGGPWPAHCMQGTPGAASHPHLRLPAGTAVVTTGSGTADDGHSAFEGRLADGRTLAEDLRGRGVTTVYAGGLATDYCVLWKALSAARWVRRRLAQRCLPAGGGPSRRRAARRRGNGAGGSAHDDA